MLMIPPVSDGYKYTYIIPGAFAVLLRFSQYIYLMAWRSGLAHTFEAGQTFDNKVEGRELASMCTEHALALN